MKIATLTGFCAVGMALYGCAGSASEPASASEGALTASVLGENGALACTTGGVQLALVAASASKTALVTLTPAANVFALSGTTGVLTTSAGAGLSWTGASGSLTLGADMKGTWTQGSDAKAVTCAPASAADAPSWKAASGLVLYASEIEGLASTVLDSTSDTNGNGTPNTSTKTPRYTVFAVETAKRASLALGVAAKDSTGALPGDDGASLLDENDWSYGGISAAYGLGGGDEYGEWFQGASDGISLAGDLGTAKASFVGHEKVASLAGVVDSAAPSVVEIGVGTWTFLVPDAFAR